MWEDCHALRAALRRPMRAWWRRAGGWWMAAIVLLMLLNGTAYIAVSLATDASFRQAAALPQVWQFVNVHSYWISSELPAVLIAVLGCLALLLGLQVAHVTHERARSLLAGLPMPGVKQHRRALFCCTMFSTWPAVAVLLVVGSGLWLNLVYFVLQLIRHFPLQWVFPHAQMGLGWLMAAPVLLAWLVALLVVRGRIGWPMTWCALAILPVLYVQVPELLWSFTGNYAVAHKLRFAKLVELGLGLGWALGGALLPVLLWSIVAGRRVLAASLFALLCLGAFLYGFGDRMPFSTRPKFNYDPAISPSSDTGIILDTLRSSAEFTQRPLAEIYSGKNVVSGHDYVSKLALGVPVEKSLLLDWNAAWLCILLNISYIALHYLFIWWLLGLLRPGPDLGAPGRASGPADQLSTPPAAEPDNP